MAAKMLIVEDERDINYVLRSNFENEGYTVYSAGTAEIGLKLAKQHKPDVIITDIMLPKMDGLEMMQRLRPDCAAPVLFLTAKKDEIDRIIGLKLGADDYITKPFSLRELSLRVKAILRRRTPKAAVKSEKAARIGGIEIDFERHEVRVAGKPVSLAPKEFELLKLLIEADGKIRSREELGKLIWGDDEGMEIDIRTVDQHVARLRKKLLSERDRIVTVNNFGYKVMTRQEKVA